MGARPPPLTFAALLDELEGCGERRPDDIHALLEQHANALRQALESVPRATAHPRSDPGAPLFREADAAPPQRDSEKNFANVVSGALGISFQAASVLLRDFLALEVDAPPKNADFQAVAPIAALRSFLRSETRASFACVAAISRNADDESHPLHAQCTSFISSNPWLAEAIVAAVEEAILRHHSSTHTLQERNRLNDFLQWSTELAFVYFYANEASVKHLQRLLQALERHRAGSVRIDDPSRPSLPSSVSLLFVLTIVEALGLEMVLHMRNANVATTDDLPAPIRTAKDLGDLHNTLDGVGQCAEITVIYLAWATVLQLRVQVTKEVLRPAPGVVVKKALGMDSLAVLTNLLARHPSTHEEPIEHGNLRLKSVGAGFLASFLTAFPPKRLRLQQVDVLTVLVTEMLRGALSLCEEMILHEADEQRRFEGVNLLLRLATACFPFCGRPLLLLLTGLASSTESADFVAQLLFSCETYALALQDDIAFSVVSAENVPHNEALALSVAAKVELGGLIENEFIVFSRDAITATGVVVPKRSLGRLIRADPDFVVVAAQWNGWQYVAHILVLLVNQLRATGLSELSNSGLISRSLAALDLIYEVCSRTSNSHTRHIFEKLLRYDIFCDLVVLLSDPRCKNVAFSPENHTLLEAASRCLCLAVQTNDKAVSIVLERLTSKFGERPLLFSVADFGASALPSLIALLRIAVVMAPSLPTDTYIPVLEFIHSEAFPFWLSLSIERQNAWEYLGISYQAFHGDKAVYALRNPVFVRVLCATITSYRLSEALEEYKRCLNSALTLLSEILAVRRDSIRDIAVLESLMEHIRKEDVMEALLTIAQGRHSIKTSNANDRERQRGLLGDAHGLARSAARCVILIFEALFEGHESSAQVGWPRDDALQKGFAKAIRVDRRPEVMDLVSTAIRTGQRAAARSLVGITTGSSEGNSRRSYDVLQATLKCLQVAFDISSERRSCHLAASAARLLFATWEMFGLVWLQTWWNDNGVWELCVRLLKGSPTAHPWSLSQLELKTAELVEYQADDPSAEPIELLDDQVLWLSARKDLFLLVALGLTYGRSIGNSKNVFWRTAADFFTSRRIGSLVSQSYTLFEDEADLESFAVEGKRMLSSASTGHWFAQTRSPGSVGRLMVSDLRALKRSCVESGQSATETQKSLTQWLAAYIMFARMQCRLALTMSVCVAHRTMVAIHPLQGSSQASTLAPPRRQILSVMKKPSMTDMNFSVHTCAQLSFWLLSLTGSAVDELEEQDSTEWSGDLALAVEWIGDALSSDSVDTTTAENCLASLLIAGGVMLSKCSVNEAASQRFIASALNAATGSTSSAKLCAGVGVAVSFIVSKEDHIVRHSGTKSEMLLTRSLMASQEQENSSGRRHEASAILTRLLVLETNKYNGNLLSGTGSLTLLLSEMRLPATSAYDRATRERSSEYHLWTAQLELAASVISLVSLSRPERKLVLEYSLGIGEHVLRHSMSLTGDWPRHGMFSDGAANLSGQSHSQIMHISLARLEEAEVSAALLWTITEHCDFILESAPTLLDDMVACLQDYLGHSYRLLRAEPIDRWVLPVSKTEVNNAIETAFSTSNKSPTVVGPRAVLGRYSSPAVLPSPGMPPTPASPAIGQQRFTPGSGTPGTGGSFNPTMARSLSSSFAEEAWRSLITGMKYSLGALRRIYDATGVALFEASMALVSNRPSLGLLVAIQLHVCNEIVHRGPDGARHSALFSVLDGALHLTLAHATDFVHQGVIGSGTRDELRKRLSSTVEKARRAVPPPPAGSLVSRPEVDEILQGLRAPAGGVA